MAASKQKTADVVIIGGGVTGVGIARDAAMRGFRTLLVEQGSIGAGTSGHFHGMLHSGARYAIDDIEVAAECFKENQILRQIAGPAILDTGGLFLALTEAEASHADKLWQACQRAGIPIADVPLTDVIKQEPNVAPPPVLKRALAVPDAFVDGRHLLRLTREAAESADMPATFLLHHKVVSARQEGGRLQSIIVQAESGEETMIECGFVVNAAGAWAAQVGRLAGVDISMVLDKGAMVVLKERLCNAILNRCRPQADGDILVPTWQHCIMGTTARPTNDPGAFAVEPDEIALLLREGAQMVPRLAQATVQMAYAGVRPLFSSLTDLGGVAGRSVSRSFRVLDHSAEGLDNFISVVGGKLTVYRQMAEAAVDLLCQKQDVFRPCQTAEISMTETKQRELVSL